MEESRAESLPMKFCYKHPTELAVARCHLEGEWRDICQLCNAVIDAKQNPKRGAPCWEDDCPEGVVFKLTGPPVRREVFGLMATLQVTTYLCTTHAIQKSVEDPSFVLEEL